MRSTKACPMCGDKRCPAVPILKYKGRPPEITAVGLCVACGWCQHTTDMSDYTAATGLCEKCDRPAVRDPRKWDTVDHLPRPAGMPDEEFRFRATMFLAWRTEQASGLRRHFEVFADYLAERGSAEEAAARAAWQPYANKGNDPKGWWQWTVPAGTGWVSIQSEIHDTVRAGQSVREDRRYIDDSRAKLTRTHHNGRWFLCWPPGFVRFTGPLHHDITRWRVTTQISRNVDASVPVERVWPGGYTQLLLPFAAGVPSLVVEGGVVKAPSHQHEDLGLFAESSEGA